MTRLFNEEGASGRAVTELSCEMMIKTGRALALTLLEKTGRKPKILIGRDTRLSSEILCAALTAGCCSAGADCVVLGVIPTPAVSYLTGRYSAEAGVMITAEHNPFEYNGIKLFGAGGDFLDRGLLEKTEKLALSQNAETRCRGGEDIGKIIYEDKAEWDYVRGLLKRIDADLRNIRVVIDCANGAGYLCAEKFFRGIGATVSLINNSPDGKNINSGCGAFDPDCLSKAVLSQRAHAGIALDGDGGRCVMADEKGNILKGDSITAIIATCLKAEGKLPSNGCVISPTMNLAFSNWAKSKGILISSAPDVGIRLMTERMKEFGYVLSGSESGHVVVGRKAADGMLAGALVLQAMAVTGKKLSELAAGYEPYETISINIRLRPEYCGRWMDVPALRELIDYTQSKLEGSGRILVRESSASPILRILAEGRDRDVVWQYATAIKKTAVDYVGEEDTEETGDENS